jgi:hypothetical protein
MRAAFTRQGYNAATAVRMMPDFFSPSPPPPPPFPPGVNSSNLTELSSGDAGSGTVGENGAWPLAGGGCPNYTDFVTLHQIVETSFGLDARGSISPPPPPPKTTWGTEATISVVQRVNDSDTIDVEVWLDLT